MHPGKKRITGLPGSFSCAPDDTVNYFFLEMLLLFYFN